MSLSHPLVNRAIDLNLNGPSFGKIDVIFLLFGILAVTRRWTSLQDLKQRIWRSCYKMASQHVIHVPTWLINLHYLLP